MAHNDSAVTPLLLLLFSWAMLLALEFCSWAMLLARESTFAPPIFFVTDVGLIHGDLGLERVLTGVWCTELAAEPARVAEPDAAIDVLRSLALAEADLVVGTFHVGESLSGYRPSRAALISRNT